MKIFQYSIDPSQRKDFNMRIFNNYFKIDRYNLIDLK